MREKDTRWQGTPLTSNQRDHGEPQKASAFRENYTVRFLENAFQARGAGGEAGEEGRVTQGFH